MTEVPLQNQRHLREDRVLDGIASKQKGPNGSIFQGRIQLKSHSPPRLTNVPDQWLQCQSNGSNVCRVLRMQGVFPFAEGVRVTPSFSADGTR